MYDTVAKRKVKFEIDLDRSRGPGAFRDKHNLWKEDLKRIYRLVQRQSETLKKAENRANREHRKTDLSRVPHLAIAIFGPSGSGKSSLLRTLEDDVGRLSGGIWKHAHLEEREIVSLPVMDPTTWSDTEQFLYAFLATALETERDRQETKDRGYPQGLSPVQLAFQDVNEYLRVVDDAGNLQEHDPLGLSLQKLERHTSGLRLKKTLGKFIEALSKEFNAKVILLPVDDLDMAPSHLVNSLQTYQSFLTHAQLVPIFTFTDRMSEELIESHYELQLSNKGSQRRLEGQTERLTVSEQLAVQFLARCFPVRNRIRLGPAPGRVQRAIFGTPIEKHEDKSEQDAKVDVTELLTVASFLLFGFPDQEDAHKVRAALRPSTLRRQFQVVDAMADCRLHAFRVPQFAKMVNEDVESQVLARLASGRSHIKKIDSWSNWPRRDAKDKETAKLFLLKHQWSPDSSRLFADDRSSYFEKLIEGLYDLKIGATWATVFNGATWSLLNVHRDTLRELGLFLEDLYSWSPKELRSVVLKNILMQDQVVRRMVVDRWGNRTDYRRSQVLSLLAANIFRPWMIGEEPHGDDEYPLREQVRLESLESNDENEDIPPIDRLWEKYRKTEAGKKQHALERLSFPATQGLLWFLNVTLGFYLPQVLARNWNDALPTDEPVRGRMSANGWDLYHAPINAMRVADARQEVFSFGMMFLDPCGYRRALERKPQKIGSRILKSTPGNRLLLRLWSCVGYSRGRIWAAFSLWRGLGFIGQVLELSWSQWPAPGSRAVGEADKANLQGRIERLIRSHCLAGLVPGTLLDRGSTEQRLRQAFPPWETDMLEENAVSGLATQLMEWISHCWEDRILPYPVGDVWVGWGDCFIRRIHGEYILGSLWPRLNSAYLEERKMVDGGVDCRELARHRSSESCDSTNRSRTGDQKGDDRFLWTASLAAAVWSDVVLEYWRGCPPILRLLLSCPVFLKSRRRFFLDSDSDTDVYRYFRKPTEDEGKKLDSQRKGWLERLAVPERVWDELTREKVAMSDKSKEEPRPGLWRKQVGEDLGKLDIPGLVPREFCIERVRVEHFASPPIQHQSVKIEREE